MFPLLRRLLDGLSSEVPVIEFLTDPDLIGVIPPPVPARKVIPEWFKKLPTEMRSGALDQFGATAMTAKRCMPLLDAMSLGYVMFTAGDARLRLDGPLLDSPPNPGLGSLIQAHSAEQIGGDPRDQPAVKFINHWIVKTAPGWSTLFMPLLNEGGDSRFECLSGLVDTDTYPKEVNFPARWLAENPFDGVIAARTPLVVAIPIHRASLMADPVTRTFSGDEIRERNRIKRCQDSRRSVYTDDLRDKRGKRGKND